MGKLKELPPTQLRISLHDPGLTPVLRAGLGGLAVAAMAIDNDRLASLGTIEVTPHEVLLDWREPKGAEPFFKALFEACFGIDDNGLVRLAGYFATEPPFEVRVAVTDALRLTFLQHGKHATKAGAPNERTFEIDDVQHTIGVQPYGSFVHQETWKSIAKALDVVPSKSKPITLAGWANPGAVERHVGLRTTNIEYSPAEALCACFAIIGCLSYQGPNRSGVLVVLEPEDLRDFADARPLLAPESLRNCFVSSTGDGVLGIHAGLLASEVKASADGVGAVSAVALRATAWAKQLKSRTDATRADTYDQETLKAFHELTSLCPPRLVRTKGKKAKDPGGYWGIPSSLRGFVATNLAARRPFYAGFALAKNSDDPPRWMHRFYGKEDHLGALRYPDDQRGIIAMSKSLGEAERLLVTSLHTALKQRFGQIASENSENSTAFKRRCQGEREKWRMAFSGARTHEQIRHALADLWSRAGTIKELQGTAWQALQPLLESEQWEAARDLALIALASYRGRGADAPDEEGEEES